MELTDKQRQALEYLDSVGSCTSAAVGHHLYPRHSELNRPLTPQGAGRLGGVLMHQLRDLGCVYSEWPRWYMTSRGRVALDETVS